MPLIVEYALSLAYALEALLQSLEGEPVVVGVVEPVLPGVPPPPPPLDPVSTVAIKEPSERKMEEVVGPSGATGATLSSSRAPTIRAALIVSG